LDERLHLSSKKGMIDSIITYVIRFPKSTLIVYVMQLDYHLC